MSPTRMLSFQSPTPPNVAVEIAPRHITAVSIARKGARCTIVEHATEVLPAGVIVPALTATNLPDPTVVVDALKRVMQRLGNRPRRIALVIPDSLAKVSFVRFEKVPDRPEDLDQLVRWQVRKTAPFRIEDAQVSTTPGAAQPGGGREFVVALARRDIIEEYERVCRAAGLHAGVIDLATFNLINVVMAGTGAALPAATPLDAGTAAVDWLVVHVTPEYSTIAIVRGGDLVFFRNLRDEGEGNLADFVHQTAMYYEDRLGGQGFARAFLAGAASPGDPAAPDAEIRRALERRLNTTVEPIDLETVADWRDQAPGPDVLDALAPPIGILLRDAA